MRVLGDCRKARGRRRAVWNAVRVVLRERSEEVVFGRIPCLRGGLRFMTGSGPDSRDCRSRLRQAGDRAVVEVRRGASLWREVRRPKEGE